jgi:hypothetical protein
MPCTTATSPLIKSFSKKQPVQTIDKLLDTCGCSLRTLRRKIKADGLISSYNKNSIFYTVPVFAKFDHNGLWHHGQASFSQWGNLFETIVHLIDQSKMGFTSSEIKSLLKIRIYDPLRVLCQKDRIQKTTIQNQNIYISTCDDIARKQIKNRNAFYKKADFTLPDSDIIIAILVEMVLDTNINQTKICKRLKKNKIQVTPVDIDAVIERYQLKKKLTISGA